MESPSARGPVGRRREDPSSSQAVGHVQGQVVELLVGVGRERC